MNMAWVAGSTGGRTWSVSKVTPAMFLDGDNGATSIPRRGSLSEWVMRYLWRPLVGSRENALPDKLSLSKHGCPSGCGAASGAANWRDTSKIDSA
jgi:hypothetical protein